MTRHNKAIASVNDVISSAEINRYIGGIGQMVTDYIERGFEPYMVTFMFKLAMLESGSKDQQMLDEINRVYGRFLTECVRNPWSERNQDNRPVLIACQDWPVWKKNKKDRLLSLPWEGAHWGSILLVPPWNRLKNGLKDHFDTYKRHVYVRPGMPLSRIHVQHIDYQPRLAVEYTLKSLVRRKCSLGDLLILPFSRSERPNR
jgi:hypothetical protein